MTRIRLAMKRQPRRGFTLIELLVVISIIALLVSLVAPAVQAARRTARRLQCLNNIRQVGIAMQTFSSTTGSLPYLTSDLHTDSGAVIQGVGWPMALLPALDQAVVLKNIKTNPVNIGTAASPIWAAFSTTNTGAYSNNNIWIPVFTCPDDADSDHALGGLSYVVSAGFIPSTIWGSTTAVNSGSSGESLITAPIILQQPYVIDWNGNGNYSTDGYTQPTGGWDATDQAVQLATGVIVRATTGAGSNSFQPSLDYVSTGDGQGNTLLLTENLNAGPWNGSLAYGSGVNQFGFGICVPVTAGAPTSGIFANTATGYGTNTNVQHTPPAYLNTEYGSFANSTSNPDFWVINRYLNLGTTGSGIAPRPSSQHAGGVNAIFCDGRGSFLSENVDKHVYAKISTSNGGTYGEFTLDAKGY